MKKILYLIVLCLLGAQHYTAQAQTHDEGPYKSIFGKDSTRWNFVYLTPFDRGPFYYRNEFVFKDDTLINGEHFKKTFMVAVHSIDRPLYQVNNFIREDTLAGKVWSRKREDTTLYLLFDYSLNTGDTFVGQWRNRYSGVVDSTAIIAGRKHVYLRSVSRNLNYAHNLEYPLVFIEGIGAVGSEILHIIGQHVRDSEYLLCAYKDGVQDMGYVNEKYGGDCNPNLNGVGIASTNQLSVQVYPNPAKESIYLEQLPSQAHTISLYDIQGRILESVANASPNYILDVSAYTKGVYILKVETLGYAPYILKYCCPVKVETRKYD